MKKLLALILFPFLLISFGGKVGYLAEFNSTKKIFNSPKEKTTQEYISGKFG